jgi:hypothetical protein
MAAGDRRVRRASRDLITSGPWTSPARPLGPPRVSALSSCTRTFGLGEGTHSQTSGPTGRRQGAPDSSRPLPGRRVNLVDTDRRYSPHPRAVEEIVGERIVEGSRDGSCWRRRPLCRWGRANDAGSRATTSSSGVRGAPAAAGQARGPHRLLQVHGGYGQTPAEETLDALVTLVRSAARSATSAARTRGLDARQGRWWISDRWAHQRFVSSRSTLAAGAGQLSK